MWLAMLNFEVIVPISESFPAGLNGMRPGRYLFPGIPQPAVQGIGFGFELPQIGPEPTSVVPFERVAEFVN